MTTKAKTPTIAVTLSADELTHIKTGLQNTIYNVTHGVIGKAPTGEDEWASLTPYLDDLRALSARLERHQKALNKAAREEAAVRQPKGRCPKVWIRQNVWGNWYGYQGGRRVAAFFNSTTETQEQAALRWLAEQTSQAQIGA